MTRRVLALLLAVTLGCDLAVAPPAPPATPAAVETSAPPADSDDMTARLLANPLPLADAFALARSVRGREGRPARLYEPVRTTPPDERPGSRERFWIYDWAAKRNFQADATLRVMTASAKWWATEDARADQGDLERAAAVFEQRIYPATRQAYGSEWTPGIDGDPRVNILVARIPGQAAGYYSSADSYPRWVYEHSAEREIVFINMPSGGRLATDELYGTLAHEMCHMIQFNKRARSVTWFIEGQAELCARVAVPASSGFESLFLQQPDAQLNDWPELGELSVLHYGGAYLFLEFLRQHAGGEALINAFLAAGIDTPADLDRVLRARGQRPLEELFADFVVANALLRERTEPRYSYAPNSVRLGQPARPGPEDRVLAGGTLRSTVRPFAARYIELPRGAGTVRFEAPARARVIPTDPRSGRAFWWSDRGDQLDSTLTRAVDLRAVQRATLRFWAWYEIESDFDYAYVMVSTDGGARWTPLRSTSSTSEDPNKVNLGHGLTGLSGGGTTPAWVEQAVDLSPFAGREVLLRIQYLTDGALNLHGIAIDDLEIPEIGWRDDAEADRDWTARGFVRSSNVVSQRYVVQVIRFADRATVERVSVPDGTVELSYDASADRRPPILVVTPFAVRTTRPAPFTVTVGPRS